MRKIITGTSDKILEIDLCSGKVKETVINNEQRRLFLGGKGLGLKLLSERLKPGTEPLSGDNIFMIMTGVYMGVGAPCSARFTALAKSPLTGVIATSSCGGPFGAALKTAGYDGLILKGKVDKPSYIEIGDGVKIKEASSLRGMDTQKTQEALNMPKGAGALVIGPAGENKVRYACAVSGDRFLGRGGLGAVMGSKNIKAIVAFGRKYKIEPQNPEKFKKIKSLGNKYIKRNFVTGELYRNYGTCSHINLCDKAGILPVRNYTSGSHPEARKVSGEAYAEKHNVKHSVCKPCSILCGHKGEFNGRVLQIPEYETAGLFGPNLLIFDRTAIAEWNHLCGLLGLDTISAGSVIGWAMEASEKNLFKSPLKFGSTEKVAEILEDIAYRRGIGDDLAEGTRRLSEKYGGKEFACHVKGLEIAAYDPRGAWGQGLSYAVANRGGCHLSAPVFSLEGTLKFLNPCVAFGKVTFTDYLENMFAAINSMHGCAFTSFAYMLEPFVARTTPKPMLSATMQIAPAAALALMDISVYSKTYEAITGLKLSQKEMLKAGRRVHVMERYLNTLEGISARDDTLPDRFLREWRRDDRKKRVVPLEKMLKKYYKAKGYDSNGIPRPETLKQLEIDI